MEPPTYGNSSSTLFSEDERSQFNNFHGKTTFLTKPKKPIYNISKDAITGNPIKVEPRNQYSNDISSVEYIISSKSNDYITQTHFTTASITLVPKNGLDHTNLQGQSFLETQVNTNFLRSQYTDQTQLGIDVVEDMDTITNIPTETMKNNIYEIDTDDKSVRDHGIKSWGAIMGGVLAITIVTVLVISYYISKHLRKAKKRNKHKELDKRSNKEDSTDPGQPRTDSNKNGTKSSSQNVLDSQATDKKVEIDSVFSSKNTKNNWTFKNFLFGRTFITSQAGIILKSLSTTSQTKNNDATNADSLFINKPNPGQKSGLLEESFSNSNSNIINVDERSKTSKSNSKSYNVSNVKTHNNDNNNSNGSFGYYCTDSDLQGADEMEVEYTAAYASTLGSDAANVGTPFNSIDNNSNPEEHHHYQKQLDSKNCNNQQLFTTSTTTTINITNSDESHSNSGVYDSNDKYDSDIPNSLSSDSWYCNKGNLEKISCSHRRSYRLSFTPTVFEVGTEHKAQNHANNITTTIPNPVFEFETKRVNLKTELEFEYKNITYDDDDDDQAVGVVLEKKSNKNLKEVDVKNGEIFEFPKKPSSAVIAPTNNKPLSFSSFYTIETKSSNECCNNYSTNYQLQSTFSKFDKPKNESSCGLTNLDENKADGLHNNSKVVKEEKEKEEEEEGNFGNHNQEKEETKNSEFTGQSSESNHNVNLGKEYGPAEYSFYYKRIFTNFKDIKGKEEELNDNFSNPVAVASSCSCSVPIGGASIFCYIPIGISTLLGSISIAKQKHEKSLNLDFEKQQQPNYYYDQFSFTFCCPIQVPKPAVLPKIKWAFPDLNTNKQKAFLNQFNYNSDGEENFDLELLVSYPDITNKCDQYGNPLLLLTSNTNNNNPDVYYSNDDINNKLIEKSVETTTTTTSQKSNNNSCQRKEVTEALKMHKIQMDNIKQYLLKTSEPFLSTDSSSEQIIQNNQHDCYQQEKEKEESKTGLLRVCHCSKYCNKNNNNNSFPDSAKLLLLNNSENLVGGGSSSSNKEPTTPENIHSNLGNQINNSGCGCASSFSLSSSSSSSLSPSSLSSSSLEFTQLYLNREGNNSDTTNLSSVFSLDLNHGISSVTEQSTILDTSSEKICLNFDLDDGKKKLST